MKRLRIVLDSNEYLFYFDNKSELLSNIIEVPDTKILVNNLIFREVLRNVSWKSIRHFINLLKNPKFVIVKEEIPEQLINKYKKLGLKKGDIVIAAFCEFIEADYLITENRHFLKRRKFDKFEVVSLRGFLAKLK